MSAEAENSYLCRSLLAIAVLALWGLDWNIGQAATDIATFLVNVTRTDMPADEATTGVTIVLYLNLGFLALMAALEWLSGGRITFE